MPHCYKKDVEEQRWWGYCVNALSGLCLIATIDQRQQEFDEIMSVSMPSRASTSLLQEELKATIRLKSRSCVNALSG